LALKLMERHHREFSLGDGDKEKANYEAPLVDGEINSFAEEKSSTGSEAIIADDKV